jgi:hypothetical protein
MCQSPRCILLTCKNMKRVSKYGYTWGKVFKQRYPAVSVAFILTGTASPSFLIPKVIHAWSVTILKIHSRYQERGENMSDSWKRSSCLEVELFFMKTQSIWKPVTFVFSRPDLYLWFCLLFSPIWGRCGLSHFVFRINFFLYDETTVWKGQFFWKHTGQVDRGDVYVQFCTK